MALTTLNPLTTFTTHYTHYTTLTTHYTHHSLHSLHSLLTIPTTHYTNYTHHSLHSPHSHLFSFFSRSRNSIGCLMKLVCLRFTSPISALALHSSSTVGPDTTSEGQGEREQQGQGKHGGLVLELSCGNVITFQSTLQAYIMMTYT